MYEARAVVRRVYEGMGLASVGSRAAMARISPHHPIVAAPAAAQNSSRLDAVETRVRRACDSGPSVGENCFPSEVSTGKLISQSDPLQVQSPSGVTSRWGVEPR